MPRAKISINGVDGTNNDLPINVVVLLDNDGNGGEVTYNWAILEQPDGTADNLSSSTIHNPTFTPKKEGTYLIELIVNQSLASEQRDQVTVGIHQLKNNQRVPAPNEELEGDANGGWAESAVNPYLQWIDKQQADPHIVVGVASGTVSRGTIVRCVGSYTIKAGLPGEEVLPQFGVASSNTFSHLWGQLGIVEGTPTNPNGAVTVGTGALIRVRFFGMFHQFSGTGFTVGDPVFLSASSGFSTTDGVYRRQLGICTAFNGGSSLGDVLFDGSAPTLVPQVATFGAASIIVDSTPYFLFPGFGGTAVAAQIIWPPPGAGLMRRLRVQATTASDVDIVFTFMLGASDQALAVTLPAGQLTVSNTNDADAFLVLRGDPVSLKATSASVGATALVNAVVTAEFVMT